MRRACGAENGQHRCDRDRTGRARDQMMTTHSKDGWVFLGTLDKFVKCELGVLVGVHVLEDLLYPLLGGVLVRWQTVSRTGHLVDGLYDLQHLVVRDQAVLVDII